MPLTNDEIRTIAQWDPIRAGFGRDDPQTEIRIKAIVDRINSSGDLGCEILEYDGLSNYFVLFAFAVADVSSNTPTRQVEGLLIYLSACGPVGVVGRSGKCVGPGCFWHDPLHLETLLSPDEANGRLEQTTIEEIRSCGYELLSVEEVSKPLPPAVEPYHEFCLGPEPWDRVFHALFGNTD